MNHKGGYFIPSCHMRPPCLAAGPGGEVAQMIGRCMPLQANVGDYGSQHATKCQTESANFAMDTTRVDCH